MKKFIPLLIFMLWTFLLTGCASKFATVDLLPDERQKALSQGGYQVLFDQRKDSYNVIIAIPQEVEDGKRIEGIIGIQNTGKNPLQIHEEDLKARLMSLEEDKKLHIFTKSELLRELEKGKTFDQAMLILAAIGNQYNANKAGYHTQTTNISGVYNNYYNGGGTFHGVATTTTFNAQEHRMAQENAIRMNQQMLATSIEKEKNKREAIKQYIFESVLIPSGQFIMKKFILDEITIDRNFVKLLVCIFIQGHENKFIFGLRQIDN